MGEFVRQGDDGVPYFAYDGNMGVVVATPDNTTIYTHDYGYRGLDHIYTSMRDEGDSTRGAFLFRVALLDSPVDFEQVLVEMRGEGYGEIVAEKPEDTDIRVFDQFADLHFKFKVKNKSIKKWLDS